MSSDREDFAEVRRLLALKRHETPPPGYYNSFSGQVIARIKAGESLPQPAFWERWFSAEGFISRCWAAFESKPALAGSFGLAVCSVLGAALFLSEPGSSDQAPVVAGFDSQPAMAMPERQFVNSAVPFSTPGGTESSSTSGVLSPGSKPSLFNGGPSLQVQPVNFQPGLQ
jgi:hypothetical protein